MTATSRPTVRRPVAQLLGAAFPESAPLRPSAVHITAYLTSFVGSLAFLLLIPSGRPHLERMWAEDGADWISDAALNPPLANLFEPLGGYFHVIPRLLAEVTVATLPTGAWAAGLAILAASVRAGCALAVFTLSRSHVKSPYTRGAMASTVILLPAGNWDTINNAANLHWFLFFTLMWAMLFRPVGRLAMVAATSFIAFAALSVPLAVVLAPLAVLRLFLPRWRDRVAGLTLLLCVVAVAGSVLASDRPREAAPLLDLLGAAAARGPLTALVGPQGVMELILLGGARYVTIATAVACLIFLAAYAGGMVWGRPSERFAIALVAVLGTIVVVLSLYSNWRDFLVVATELRTPRYSALPALLFTSAAIISVGAIWRTRSGAGVIAGALLGSVLLASVAWQIGYPPDKAGSPVLTGITWSDGLSDAKAKCDREDRDVVGVEILPHSGWRSVLPCEVVGR